MPRIRHALILAAGRGRRMMPYTDAIPKPMAPCLGSTLIAHGIARLAKRVDRIHVTVGYKGAMLAQYLIQQGVNSIFNTDGKGTAWWIYNTLLGHLDEPIYVFTCDILVALDYDCLEEEYLRLGAPPCLLVPAQAVPGIEGDFIFHRNRVVTALSRTEMSEMYCSGIQILNPCRLSRTTREAGDFDAVWTQLISQGQLFVSSVYPETWVAVDTMEQLSRV